MKENKQPPLSYEEQTGNKRSNRAGYSRDRIYAVNDFTEFQKCFKHYQKLFGLTGYKVYFKHEPLVDCFADITIKQADMVATVCLNSNVSDKSKPFRDIKQSAKHEALHLLLSRIEDRAVYRFGTQSEIYEVIEEAVNKLEDLIDG